jgi:hypothetical protein
MEDRIRGKVVTAMGVTSLGPPMGCIAPGTFVDHRFTVDGLILSAEVTAVVLDDKSERGAASARRKSVVIDLYRRGD